MSLEKMELQELVGDLVSIGQLILVCQQERNSSLPEIKTRGIQQLPVLLKCEGLLSNELHHRLGGYTEFAEVAIDALEEEYLRRRGLQEAEEREALGTTIRDIEAAEAKATEAFETLHPEVICDIEMLYTVKGHIDKAIAKEEALRRAMETEHPGVVDSGVPMEFHKPGECIRISPNERSIFETPKTHLHIRDSGDHSMGTTPTHKLDVVSGDSIHWAMKEVAWDSLQHLGSDVLFEYLELWRKKHHDYGPENHAVWGAQGALIRASDKLLRLKRHYVNGFEMRNESVEDSWLDLIGYALIGLVIERGQWPAMELHAVIRAMQEEILDAQIEAEEKYEREHD